jgi:enolase
MYLIQDGFDEDDWEAWTAFTKDVGNDIQIVGKYIYIYIYIYMNTYIYICIYTHICIDKYIFVE